ncbi:MAG: hypothetical protein KAH54_09625 [Candidatus Sabulitectum sp.]|nr:hypothetical protein [Candidatus Sabulitectum sp.]
MRIYFSVMALIVLLMCSCSLFEPRVPEDPSSGGVVWVDPTSPDLVVENMQSALNGSSALYMDCFAQSFVFYADTSDINDYLTYNFNDWDWSVENTTVLTLYSLVPSDSTVTAEFLIDMSHPDPAAPADSAIIYREYSITVPQSFHSGTGAPAVGLAELHLVEDGEGLWSVTEWHDARHEEATEWVTWAVAKAFYR